MPTFHSIPIHPSVRSRLLRPHQQYNNADGSSSKDHQYSRQQQRQRQQQLVRSSVSIPRSLLTRDPNDLVDMIFRDDIRNEQQRVGICAQMEDMRCQVARKMISKSRNGKRLLSNHRDEPQCSQKHKKCRPLIPGGSMSILNAWNTQHETLLKDQDHPQIFSTGCGDLDNLIAFPPEYFSEANGTQDMATPCNIDLISSEAKGLPQGYIMKVSGTSGKTQLAIQLVSQVLMQSYNHSTEKSKRIRYCYSTAGHSGHSLAQRLFQLLENNANNNDENTLKGVTKKIEFQPITTVAQLISAIAKIEEEWAQHTASISLESPGDERGQCTVSMLVLDALPLMVAEREDAVKIQSLERWLKRLARHYSLLIVIVTAKGGAGSSSIYDNAMSPDIHLQLQKRTPSTLSIHLLRHPTKLVTENNCIMYTPRKFDD